MSLRNILYIDTKAIDDYVSQIDGYTYEEETIINNKSNEKGGKAGINFSKVSAEGSLETQNSESSTKNVKITNASKLDKVIKYLNKENELKYFECINDEIWQNICRDDFIEVLVTPRFSKIREMSEAAKNLNNLVNVFQQFVDKPIIDNKAKEAINGLESLGKIKNNNLLTCVFNFEDKKYPLIAYLDESYLKISKDDFNTQSYMFCKVQRKIDKGQKMELDEIFEDIKSLGLNRDQRRKLPKNFSNPKEIKDVVNGPAFIVTPIAIYK